MVIDFLTRAYCDITLLFIFVNFNLSLQQLQKQLGEGSLGRLINMDSRSEILIFFNNYFIENEKLMFSNVCINFPKILNREIK